MTQLKPATVAQRLQDTFPLPLRTFGVDASAVGSAEWQRRRFFANILVGGSRDENAVKAATWLCNKYTLEDLADESREAELFRDIADKIETRYRIRFAGRKAGYVLKSARMLLKEFDGQVPQTERELIRFPGIAKHASDIIRGLTFGQDTFGIDVHVRRVVARMGLVPPKAKDGVIAQAFLSLPQPAHTSRAMVDLGKAHCGFRAQCQGCPFQGQGCNPQAA